MKTNDGLRGITDDLGHQQCDLHNRLQFLTELRPPIVSEVFQRGNLLLEGEHYIIRAHAVGEFVQESTIFGGIEFWQSMQGFTEELFRDFARSIHPDGSVNSSGR